MQLSIIHEDDDILVLNKPSGLVVHPYDFSKEETLLHAIERYLEVLPLIENTKILQDKREIHLSGIVHKLDRETSGVIVFAKSKTAFDELSSQFKNHAVEKIYHAYVEGRVEQDSFVIDAPLGRERKSFKQTVLPTNYRGELRDAVTEVKVLERFQNSTLVELRPKTGRTHQLRAHMAFINHPIIGDHLYGEKEEKKTGRLLLHAKEIAFTLKGKEMRFEAPCGEDFRCPQLGSNQRPAD